MVCFAIHGGYNINCNIVVRQVVFIFAREKYQSFNNGITRIHKIELQSLDVKTAVRQLKDICFICSGWQRGTEKTDYLHMKHCREVGDIFKCCGIVENILVKAIASEADESNKCT